MTEAREMTEGSEPLDVAFAAHRRALWALAYRMLGTASDAEDAVQDAFLRAMERPPADVGRPWRPWLVTVLMNRCRDRLRRRRRRGYPGPWLPSPLDTSHPEDLATDSLFASAGPSPEARVELLESVSMAFLVAAEVLTPQQRAVLVLRDVCDCSGAETAELLGMSVGNVKVTLHRARRALEAADPERPRPSPAQSLAAMEVIGRFAAAIQAGTREALQEVIAEDAVLLSDGGGVVHAANRPVHGATTIAAIYHGLARRTGEASWQVATVNGLPAVVIDIADPPRGWSRRSVLTLVPDADGKVARVYSVVAPAKVEDARLLGQTP